MNSQTLNIVRQVFFGAAEPKYNFSDDDRLLAYFNDFWLSRTL
jgi:hypothetical protein